MAHIKDFPMLIRRTFVVLGLVVAWQGAFASAQVIRFEMIPSALGANDLSPDGRYVVGEADFDGDGWVDGSYRYDFVTNTLTNLHLTSDPTTTVPVVAVSDDGSIILGNTPDPNDMDGNGIGDVAAIWRASTSEWESLGYLPNALECPSRSSGYEISADGSVAVGLSWDGCSGRGFRWTQAGGMIELQVLANGGNRASVLSADGAIIGGFAQGTFSRTPAVWYADGSGELLDPTADAQGEITGITEDGTILLGEWLTTEPVTRASMWTGGPGDWTRTQIGAGSRLPGWSGIPMDISDDGTIVGFDFLVGARRAWIQPQGTGVLQDLKPYIEAHGAVVPTFLTLEVCQAISNDGRFIVGHGFGTGAWRITILSECPADVTGDGVVGLSDLGVMLAVYGTCAGDAGFDSSADVDGDLCVTLSDLGVLLSAYGTTCP